MDTQIDQVDLESVPVSVTAALPGTVTLPIEATTTYNHRNHLNQTPPYQRLTKALQHDSRCGHEVC